MLLRIDQVLKPAKLKMIQEALGDSALFEDGQRTAGRSARQVKRNLQVRPGARLDVLGKEVERALRDNEVFMAAVR